MKQGFKAAMLIGALLALGSGAQSQAATESKKAPQVVKKADSKAAAATGKVSKSAALPAVKPAATKTPTKSASASAAGKSSAKHTSASHAGVKKHAHKVAVADVDSAHLALHSASALVIDQETGNALFEKQSGAVVPIASISKLMTAMVVLDAKLDMNEVIAIGDDDAQHHE